MTKKYKKMTKLLFFKTSGLAWFPGPQEFIPDTPDVENIPKYSQKDNFSIGGEVSEEGGGWGGGHQCGINRVSIQHLVGIYPTSLHCGIDARLLR